MANNSFDIADLIKAVPLDDIAAKFGVDKDTATAAVNQALPGLLGGLAVNAQDSDGSAKLAAALKQHEGTDLSAGLSAVDTTDGKKIVKHVLGDKEESVAKALSENAGGGIGDLIPKLLPILAPIVMSFLASKMLGGAQASDAAATTASTDNGLAGGLGDLLGGLLGGGNSSAANTGGGLGDLLGGLLGDGNSSSGGLGDLLGGLLGGK